MREGWKKEKLKDVCEVFTDGDWIQSKDQSVDGIRLIQTGNIGFGFFKGKEDKARYITEDTFNRLKCTEILPGDLLVSRLPDPVGKSCIIPDISSRMITGVDCTIIRLKDYLNSEFLRFYQMSNEYLNDVQSLVSGTTRSRISRKNLGLIQIPIPPLQEQKQIVEILDQAFEAIDKAKANLDKNIVNAKELFQAKLNAIFSHKGEGWEEKSWKEVLEIRSGRNQKEVENSNGKYPIIGSAGKVMNYADDYICEEGTTIIGRKGTINNPMYLETKFWNVDTAFGLHALDGLDKKFLYFFCLSYDFTQRDKGSGRPSLVKNDLLKMTMNVPSDLKQIEVVRHCEGLKSDLERLELVYNHKLESLDELKISILQKAFAGELTQKEELV